MVDIWLLQIHLQHDAKTSIRNETASWITLLSENSMLQPTRLPAGKRHLANDLGHKRDLFTIVQVRSAHNQAIRGINHTSPKFSLSKVLTIHPLSLLPTESLLLTFHHASLSL